MEVINDVGALGLGKGVLGARDGVDGSEDDTGKTTQLDYVLGEDDTGDAAIRRIRREDRRELSRTDAMHERSEGNIMRRNMKVNRSETARVSRVVVHNEMTGRHGARRCEESKVVSKKIGQ